MTRYNRACWLKENWFAWFLKLHWIQSVISKWIKQLNFNLSWKLAVYQVASHFSWVFAWGGKVKVLYPFPIEMEYIFNNFYFADATKSSPLSGPHPDCCLQQTKLFWA